MNRSGEDRSFRIWVLCMGALLGGLAVWRWFVSGAPAGGDGFQYLSHALALLEGRPYGDIGYLYSPPAWTVGPPVFPPGLPLTLVPLLAVFGPDSDAPRWLMHGLLLVFVLMVGRYFARDGQREVAWGTAALVAAAFLLADRPNVVGSDLGLCALAWALLVLADAPGAWSVGRTIAVTTLGFAAMLFRVAAGPLVPAGVLFVALNRRSGWRAAVPPVLWLGTVLLVVLRFGPGADPGNSMANGGPGGGRRGLIAMFFGMVERLDSKALHYRFALTEAVLYPFPSDLVNDVYHVVALLLAGFGLWIWVRQRAFAFSTLFAVMTLLMLIAAPVWQARYLWVLTPFVAFGFLNGVGALSARVRSGSIRGSHAPDPRAVTIVATAVIALSVGMALLQPKTTLPPERDTWIQVSETLRNLPGESIRVASNRPRKVTWYTGVPAMPVFDRDLAVFLSEARRLGATYVVLTPTGSPDDLLERFEQWRGDNPDLFGPVGTIGSVQLFEIISGSER